LPFQPRTSWCRTAERTKRMGHVESCVIWGDDPETRQRLGAGVPGTSGRSFQGTAAEAAVPISSSRGRSGSRGHFGRPRPAILALAAALGACGGFPASAAEIGGNGLAMSAGIPQVDAATGIAGVVFPIEVPPGRHHLQPDLALRYTSAAGPGNAGNGFTIEAGSIERTTRYGPPRFDNTDTFVLTLNGQSQELVAVDADSTRFRTAIETGFLVARLSPGPFGAASTYWVARGRDGRAYRFGFNGDAASGNVSQVLNFKWGLDRVEDASGNVMEIRHQSQGLRLYPIRIEYASHPATGLAASNVVLICWERRGANVEGHGEATLADCVRATLRQNPDRVIVGEIRGVEVVDMLRAMSQGNDGSMSSIHADSSKGALVRLGMYTAEAGLDEETSNKWIANAVDLIVHLGWVDGVRRVTSVREVLEAEARQVATNEVYCFSADGHAAPAPGPAIRDVTLTRLTAAGFDPAHLSSPTAGRW